MITVRIDQFIISSQLLLSLTIYLFSMIMPDSLHYGMLLQGQM